MNVLDVLTQQHREVDELFAKIDKFDRELHDAIKSKLLNHGNLEETIFYPALESKQETKDLVAHAREEHAEMKAILASWEDTKRGTWPVVGDTLKETVQHHVAEEESEMFPKVREAFSEEELEDLARQMGY